MRNETPVFGALHLNSAIIITADAHHPLPLLFVEADDESAHIERTSQTVIETPNAPAPSSRKRKRTAQQDDTPDSSSNGQFVCDQCNHVCSFSNSQTLKMHSETCTPKRGCSVPEDVQ
ncbi:hypothetical protein ACEPAF_1866 [Sanghuangporus sanghuang]